MTSDKKTGNKTLAVLGAALALYILGTVAFIYIKERSPAVVPVSFGNEPPRIEFDCQPPGEMDLKTSRCRLKMTDDQGLDFSTYRMYIKELDREYDLPIEGGMIGRDYETDVSFGLLADKPELTDHGKLTVRFSIADNSGRTTELERSFLLSTWRQTGIRD